jgi:hypothetical protein
MAKLRVVPGIMALVAVLLAACAPARVAEQTANGPSVTVSNPKPYQTVAADQEILVTSTSTDPEGIQRVELWADGALARTDVNPDAASPYVVAQPWQSGEPGSHVFIVKAFDARGAEGQSQPVIIAVEPPPSPTVVAFVSPPPTETSQPATRKPPPPTPTMTPLPPPTRTPEPAEPTTAPANPTPVPVCTPPPCQVGEVYYCPNTCSGGCGMQCATPTPTPTRPVFKPTGIETHPILKPIWDKPEVKDVLGYPSAAASDDRQYARQYFERGYMYWWNRPDARGLIWVVQMPDAGAMMGFGWIGPFEDTWDGGDPFSCDLARKNPNGPRSGFGRLWCEHPEIAQTVGAAREPERGTGESNSYGVVQTFQGGTMLYSPLEREVWVLVNGGSWQRYFR